MPIWRQANEQEEPVAVERQIIWQYDLFPYLGFIVPKDGEINLNISNRIQTGWSKWRTTTGVLCDNTSKWLRRKFGKIAIMLYGSECWTMKKVVTSRMNVVKMSMLRWMRGKIWKDKIRDEEVRRNQKVTMAEDVKLNIW